nr:MAG TPA: DNA-directed RNA polymerase [Caudoviricetes sp.]
MDEYITKEQVIEWFRPYGHVDEGIPYYGLVTDVREMKAAAVAPVRHGRWEYIPQTINTLSRSSCSVCGWWTLDPSVDGAYNYCPCCGAKMMEVAE